MINIQIGKIQYRNGFYIRYQKPVFCPKCNNKLAMWHYGYRHRKLRNFEGECYWIFLPKYRCQKCGKVYWTLPDFLLPYKQYDKDTITKIQNGCTNGCGASYLSIYFWKKSVTS